MNHPNLIVMLTHHDVTVENSKEIFLAAKDAPAQFWGFKDVGISEDKMRDLVNCMKEAGKTTCMEILAKDEETGLKGAKLAVECKFDYILGTHYYDSICELAAENNIKYHPFVGKREGGRLYGEISEIVAEAQEVCKKNVTGINISGYRYVGDADALINTLVHSVNKPVSCAGSVDSYARLDSIKSVKPWAFTIGGAFFEKKFGETFAEQIAVVDAYLKK